MNKPVFSTISLALIAVLSLPGCGDSATSDSHVTTAAALFEQGDVASATIELKNALQLDGRNAAARLLLGKVYLENGQILEADKELRRAGELGIDDNDLQPYWVRVLLPQRKFEELYAIDADSLAPGPATEVMAVQALGYLMQGQLVEAAALIDTGIEKNPESIAILLVKARLHGARREQSSMREQVQQIIDMESENAEAWVLLGDIEMSKGRFDLANSAYTNAIEHARNPLDARLKRAFVRIQDNNYEAAQEDLDVLMKVAPHSPGVNYAQGLVSFHSQEFEKAVTAFAVAERDKKRFPMALLFSGTSHFMLGNKDQAEGFANQFHAIAPENVAGSKLLATIILPKGDYARVEKLVRPVVAVYPNDVAALNLLANSLMSQGQTEEALDILSRVTQLEPDSSAAQIRLGAGMLMTGDQGAGVEKLQAALALNPEFQQADILLVLNHVQNKEYDKAIAAAKGYRLRNPTSVTPYNLLGRVYLQAGQQDLAVESFNNALEIDAGDPAAHTNLAGLAKANDDTASARQHYESILKHHTDNLAALIQLAALDAEANHEEAMVARLEQAMAVHPDALQPRVLMARYYLTTNRAVSVPLLFSELDDVQKNVPAVLNVIALSQLAQKDYAAARYSLGQLERLQPGSAMVHHQMAMAQAGLNNPVKLREELEKAIELSPDYLPARLALARLLLSQQQAGAAAVHIAHLKRLAPDYPDVLLLEAAEARLQGDNQTSLAKVTKAYEISPSSITVMTLSAEYLRNDETAKAIQIQREWIEEHLEDVTVRLVLAEYLTRIGQQEQALEQYRKILDYDDSNLVALNNLGWFLLETEPVLALRYAERANSLQPDSAAVLDTLAMVQLKNGDISKANRSIDRALELQPKHPAMLLHSAQIKLADGDKGQAKRILQKLIDADRDFAERDEAVQLLGNL